MCIFTGQLSTCVDYRVSQFSSILYPLGLRQFSIHPLTSRQKFIAIMKGQKKSEKTSYVKTMQYTFLSLKKTPLISKIVITQSIFITENKAKHKLRSVIYPLLCNFLQLVENFSSNAFGCLFLRSPCRCNLIAELN